MRKIFLLSILLISGFLSAQKEEDIFVVDSNFRIKAEEMSGSAFMQYSGFVPRNLKELLISMSGNHFGDSLLIRMNRDTLLMNGVSFFDDIFRKDYGLTSAYSPTLTMFFKYKLYDESLVKIAIILIYYEYLTQDTISISSLVKECLAGHKKQNSKAKKRLRKEEAARKQ